MNRTLLAHLALTIVAVIYAANYLIAKAVLDPGYIRPFGFILLRVTAAVMVFWAVDLLFLQTRVNRRDLPYLAACGLFGVAINQLCFFAGLKLTVPINASLLMTTTPILVLVTASVILKETISRRKLFGIGLGMTGALMLITRGFEESFTGSGTFWGDVLIIVNASSYAIYLVIVKKMMLRYPPLAVIKWVFTFGWVPVFLLGIWDIPDITWSTMPDSVLWAVAYVLLLTTIVAYFLNAWSLSVVSPTVTSIYIYLQPLLTTLLSVAYAKDQLDSVKSLSGMLIILGVFLVSSARNTSRTP